MKKQLVARGTYGKIYKVREGDQILAVKEMKKVSEFSQEVEIARRFSGRPYFVPILDTREDEDKVCITMPYIKHTLLDLVSKKSEEAHKRNKKNKNNHKNNKPVLSLTSICIFIEQLVSALETMHNEGFVHKDLKLENILYQNGTIYLCDYGYSKPYIRGTKSLQDRLGSLHYSAPELWHGVPYEGPECDVWALGVCVYLMATGYFPFGGETHDQVFESIETSCGIYFPPECSSRRLQDLIRKMLTYHPDERITLSEIRAHPFMAASARKPTEFSKKKVCAGSVVDFAIPPPLMRSGTNTDLIQSNQKKLEPASSDESIVSIPQPSRPRGRIAKIRSWLRLR